MGKLTPTPSILQPGGVLLVSFCAGEGRKLKTEGYGGHEMNVYVHHRSPAQVAGWLAAPGFTIEAENGPPPCSGR
jgi:hypothetical protein